MVRVAPSQSSDQLFRIAIILAGLLAYANGFQGTFIYDDIFSILENHTIQHLWPPWIAFSPPIYTPVAGRPLVNYSLAINYAISQYHPWSYHAFNLALHILCGLLLYELIRKTLIQPRFDGRWTDASRWIASSIAIPWIVHPLLSESVMYITQRTELLVSVFMLLALLCSMQGFSSTKTGRWSAATVACCVAGASCKELIAVAPLLILLHDRCFLAGSFLAAIQKRVSLYLGLTITWAMVSHTVIAGSRADVVGFSLTVGPLDYLRTQMNVIVHYIRLCFWPHPLLISYDWPVTTNWGETLPATLCIAALLVATIVGLRRRNAIAYAGAWFFIILAPTSSFIPIVTEVAAERRMYLPLAAVITLVASIVFRASRSLIARRGLSPNSAERLTFVLALAACVPLIYGTISRNRDYRSDVGMWRNIISLLPDNATAHNNLGCLLGLKGELDEAKEHFMRAIHINPESPLAYCGLGDVYQMRNMKDEAIQQYREALKRDPHYIKALVNLGVFLCEAGRTNEALQHYEIAVSLEPDNSTVRIAYGRALRAAEEYEKAARQFQQAIRISPHLADPYYDYGFLLIQTGQIDAGIAQVHEGLLRRPDARAYYLVGLLLADRNRYDDAVAYLTEALRVQPDYPEAQEALMNLQSGRRN